MELSCPLGTTRRVPQAFIDQACSVKMAGYWPRSFFFFCKFMDLYSVSVHKHAKKERGQYPAILTSHLVNNPFIWLFNPRVKLCLQFTKHNYNPELKKHKNKVILLTKSLSVVSELTHIFINLSRTLDAKTLTCKLIKYHFTPKVKIWII